jgi:hypothetical protein
MLFAPAVLGKSQQPFHLGADFVSFASPMAIFMTMKAFLITSAARLISL